MNVTRARTKFKAEETVESLSRRSMTKKLAKRTLSNERKLRTLCASEVLL